MDALGSLFASILAGAGEERARAVRLRLGWARVSGPALAARARIEAQKDGGVVLHVCDRRWAAEIRNLVPLLAGRLRDEIGAVGAIEVRVESEAEASAARGLRPPPPPPAAPRDLGPALVRAAERIRDPELRQRLCATAAAYLAAAASEDSQ